MRHITIGLCIGIVFCLSLGAFFFNFQTLQTPNSNAAAALTAPLLVDQPTINAMVIPEEDKTETRLDSLEKNLERLSEDMGVLADVITSLQDDLNAERKSATNEKLTQEQAEPMTAEETNLLLEQALADSMGTDKIWAEQTSNKVNQIFWDVPELTVAESNQATCGSDMCKVTAVLPAVAADQADLFHLSLLQSVAADLPRALTKIDHLPDGSQQYTLYMARAGYRLPTEGGGLIESEEETN